MRFDLEISNLHTDLVYISQNQEIPSGVVPLYYINMDTREKLPSDFFSFEDNILTNSYAGQGYQSITGPSFTAVGNKFLLTHIASTSTVGSARVPLFHKHVIYDKVHESSLRIVDYFGVQIPREEYLVEEKPTHTNIYINKTQKILFVEYVSDSRIYKRLLDLQPVFTEIGWEDIVLFTERLPEYKYMVTENTIETSYEGKLYIKYNYETDLLRMPIANMEDGWYLGILNTSFTLEKTVEGQGIISNNYSVPEYYAQRNDTDGNFRKMEHVKARVLFENYIQLQTGVAREKVDDIYVYVHDFYTGAIKHAVTTNKSLNGKLYKDNIYYIYTSDYNADGVIGLPVKLTSTDIVYSTYFFFEDYYEFKMLNLNSPVLNNGGLFGIFLIPNVTEMEESVYFARIGIPRTEENLPGIFRQGMQFETLNEYYEFIDANNCYNISVISICGNFESTILDTKDARINGGDIIDRYTACRNSVDMIYKDIIDGNITIPTNDTLLAQVDMLKLEDRGLATILERDSLLVDDATKEFLVKIQNTIQNNTDASTSVIIEGII